MVERVERHGRPAGPGLGGEPAPPGAAGDPLPRPTEGLNVSPLRETFDSVAATHDVRPSYPRQLFDDLVSIADLAPGDRLLEIGCAIGTATLPLLERGFRMTCVEIGPRLAEAARRRLADYPWYGAEEYIALLNTFSGHIRMPADRREYLYGQIRERIARRTDPRVRRGWYVILHVARRRG
jgi:hypothetical protein